MVEAAALQVFGNIEIDQPDLPPAGVGVGLADRCLALAQRLHLSSGEYDAGLEHLADFIVEARLTIVGDDLQLAIGFRGHRPSAGASARAPICATERSRCR